ncbi:MAG: hypothetical protein ACYCSQ_01460 [bacterium]
MQQTSLSGNIPLDANMNLDVKNMSEIELPIFLQDTAAKSSW